MGSLDQHAANVPGRSARVVVADDHPVVRAGLRLLLESAGYSVVGEAGDGKAAATVVAEADADVLILDLGMPETVGVVPDLLRRTPHARVIVYSMQVTPMTVLGALQAGAAGYVAKDRPTTDMLEAIETVLADPHRIYVSPPLEPLVDEARRSPASPDPLHALSRREREVFCLAAEGLSNAAIAEKLGTSPRTVETQRASLMRKLGLRHQADLIRFAMLYGFPAVR